MSVQIYKDFDAFTEAEEVVRTVDLYGKNGRRYRIEVLKCYSNQNIPFTSRTYEEVEISVTPAYPDVPRGWFQGAQRSVWVLLDGIADTSRDTAESVLSQAMGYLAEHAKGANQDPEVD